MDRSGAKARAGHRKREPLGDGSSRANIPASPARTLKNSSLVSPSSSTSSPIPHHESVNNNGALRSRNAPIEEDSDEDYEDDDKRVSQHSTAASDASAKGMKRKTHIGPWQLGASIGGGSVGVVRKVRHALTGQLAAVKIISKSNADMSRAESMANFAKTYKPAGGEGVTLPFGIEREVVIMKLLEHRNIVRLYDVWENRSQLYLVMEYVEGGELFDYIKEGPLQEDEAAWIFRQICAALLHAHQFRIYHRDLKPENILLSHQYDPHTGRYNPQIKLVDFGMAALQPRGKNLISPCGSVHYAAPEIFRKRYDGAKADVWSLGIILYVMLVGTIPFPWSTTDPDINFGEWYKTITSGRIDVPGHLSTEARDLIKHMLISNPQQRISLQNVWSHPFLKKWSVAWQESPEERAIESWIEVAKPLEDWSLHRKAQVDRDLLRNLRVLWHNETEATMIGRLLNSENNLEKYFYQALMRHREEQQENYSGMPDELVYSSSDYHHLKPVLHPSEVPAVPSSAFQRTKSGFSILNEEESKTSRANSTKPTPSERSYDPYRSSRPAMTKDGSPTCTVTVHRDSSSSQPRSSTGPPTKGPASLRVEALRKQQRLSSSSSGHLKVYKQSSPASRRTNSRSSMGSSLGHSSPSASIVVKPSDRHKRGVDFSQVRKSSTSNQLSLRSFNSSSLPETPQSNRRKPVITEDSIAEDAPAVEETISQPELSSDALVGSRPDPLFGDAQRARVRRVATHSQVIETEARKVSTELETLCEVAFNRDSAASTATSGARARSSYETPPSSVSNRGSAHSARGLVPPPVALTHSLSSKSPGTRSDGSSETPNTYIQRELQETRQKIARRYAKDEHAQTNPNYEEVLAQIDSLLEPQGGRVAQPRQTQEFPQFQPRRLPAIAEKASLEEGSLRRQAQMRTAVNFSRHAPSSSQQSDIRDTIRLIDQPSPKRPAPLNVRKTGTVSSHGSTAPPTPTPLPLASRPDRHHHRAHAAAGASASNRRIRNDSLGAIAEEGSNREPLTKAPEPIQPKKKRNWFWRRTEEENQPALSADDTVKGRKRESQTSSTPSTGSRKIDVPGKRPGFLAFLSGRKKPERERGFEGRQMMMHDNDSVMSSRMDGDNMSTTTSYTRKTSNGLQRQGSQRHSGGRNMEASKPAQKVGLRELGVQRNWLARFLNIRPASQVMCFDVNRGRARQVLVRILRSWRTYGIEDVVLDREKNLIFGRLVADNYLRYKPMDFVIELFVVLEYGMRANLSLARFTQRKGAASSFFKLIATLEDVLMRKGLMVENAARRQEMEAILHG